MGVVNLVNVLVTLGREVSSTLLHLRGNPGLVDILQYPGRVDLLQRSLMLVKEAFFVRLSVAMMVQLHSLGHKAGAVEVRVGSAHLFQIPRVRHTTKGFKPVIYTD